MAVASPADRQTARPRGGRILLLDDDCRVLLLLRDCLTWLGHQVDAVSTSRDALARLEVQRYDLLLTDLAMPHMSGLEVSEAARALHPALPIVVTSGAATDKDLDRMRELNASFLSKPVSLRVLEDTIRLAVAAVAEDREVLA